MAQAMPMREFKALVERVLNSLPEIIQAHMDNVVVDVARKPDVALLRRADFSDEEIRAGETLLGFFEPLELPELFSSDVIDVSDLPHRLWIFKEPHEEEFPDPKQLRIEIRKTVIHELAHHFGWTDRDLERFDNTPNPFGDDEPL